MKIHMRQNPKLNGCGWTYCGLSQFHKRTNKWKKVTCKNCLKLKKNENSRRNKEG